MGWDLSAPLMWREYLEAAGFTDIHIQWYNWPVGPWAKYKKNKILGKLTFVDFFDLLSSVGPLFQKFLDYSSEETQILIAEVRKEMREQKLHFYQPICFCYAKKPGKLSTENSPTTVPVTVPETALQPEDVHMTVPTAALEAVPEAVPKTAPETVPAPDPETAPLTVPASVLQPEDVHMTVPTATLEAVPEAIPEAAPKTAPETVPALDPETATRILPP
jgi:hypothetical protein